jgi:hypothetical protein
MELGFAELWPPDGDVAGGVSHYCLLTLLTLPVSLSLDIMGKRLMAAQHADDLPLGSCVTCNTCKQSSFYGMFSPCYTCAGGLLSLSVTLMLYISRTATTTTTLPGVLGSHAALHESTHRGVHSSACVGGGAFPTFECCS